MPVEMKKYLGRGGGGGGGAGLYKNFFNKPGHNFDDVSKTGYPRSS